MKKKKTHKTTTSSSWYVRVKGSTAFEVAVTLPGKVENIYKKGKQYRI